jgi:hypothetical protein
VVVYLCVVFSSVVLPASHVFVRAYMCLVRRLRFVPLLLLVFLRGKNKCSVFTYLIQFFFYFCVERCFLTLWFVELYSFLL